MKHLRNVLVFLLLLSASSCKKCCRLNEDSDKCQEEEIIKSTDQDITVQISYKDPKTGEDVTEELTLKRPEEGRCLYDIPANCNDYAPLVTATEALGNTADELANERVSNNDADGDGVADYIEEAKTDKAQDAAKEIATVIKTEAASKLELEISTEVESKLEISGVTNASQASKLLQSSVTATVSEEIEKLIDSVVVKVISEVIPDDAVEVDYVALNEAIKKEVEKELNSKLENIIASTMTESLESLVENDMLEYSSAEETLSPSEILEVSQSSAKTVSEFVVENETVKEKVDEKIVDLEKEIEVLEIQAQENQLQNNPASLKGSCADGYHVISDAEMKKIERFLQIPDDEINLSGKEFDRGASVNAREAWENMMSKDVITYSGYIDRDSGFVQIDIVDAFFTSTAGRDENGSYVWIRYVDKMQHQGIIRQKHYQEEQNYQTSFGVFCVKNK